jgi:DNA-binding transcriptional MerR regulator
VDSYRISEIAERSGFSPATLRYYEDVGVLAPAGRSRNGYRVYNDRSLEWLAFIAQAKRLGLSLDDLRDLASLWDRDECAPVQQHLAELVAAKRTQTQQQILELTAFAAQLQTMAARLQGEPPHPGPCGQDCACLAEADGAPVTLGRRSAPAPEPPPIACTLDAGARRARLADWQRLLARAEEREAIEGGILIRFGPDGDIASNVAVLAASEQSCCPFFDFTIHLTAAGTDLEVRAPADAAHLVTAMFPAPT